jgi:hypothetical protein
MKHYIVIAYEKVLGSFDTLDEAQDLAISIYLYTDCTTVIIWDTITDCEVF